MSTRTVSRTDSGNAVARPASSPHDQARIRERGDHVVVAREDPLALGGPPHWRFGPQRVVEGIRVGQDIMGEQVEGERDHGTQVGSGRPEDSTGALVRARCSRSIVGAYA